MSNNSDMAKGHLAAMITIFVWGTTYISTKVLLRAFQPIEILFIRFVIGFFVLCLICPRRLKIKAAERKYFLLAGLFGIAGYYLLENMALVYTQATNVGVVSSLAPFFTALFSKLFLKEEKLSKNFFLGFLLAIVGVVLLSYRGTVQFNPIGDVLAVLATVVWGAYSVVTKKISDFGYNSILVTRRTFFYGIIFMMPVMYLMKFNPDYRQFLNPVMCGNLLFLGMGASAMCFVTWNVAVKKLGSIKTSIYIYLVPVITTITSIIILHEILTKLALFGIICTMIGSIISQRTVHAKK